MERFGPTRRGGPVFRWLGMPLALDLANTTMVVREGEAVDLLANPGDLGRWLEAERDRLGDCAFAVEHLEEIRALRDAVRSLLGASAQRVIPPPEALELVNAASGAAPTTLQLEVGSGPELRMVERGDDDDPVAGLLGRLARSAIALLTGSEREQLQMCAAPSCGMFFLGTQRWCSAPCGNRARVARHYRRKRAEAATRPGSVKVGFDNSHRTHCDPLIRSHPTPK